jgi:hypothetical protein
MKQNEQEIREAEKELGNEGMKPRSEQLTFAKAAMRHMMEWNDTHGLLGNSLPLHAILGREPRRLKTYFEELHRGK